MPIVFLRQARRELHRAADWYGARKPGLDEEFYSAIEAALDLIRQLPNAHPPIPGGARRILLVRFPYALIYVIEGDRILIVACAHTKRRPGYWRGRK